ncbi:MAG: hypothetical protein RBS37_07165 [Bacteroidales bacterium]|jgi:hypothetical protein|nr:hypothetical protein [Bacteroidales bacterium]
MALPIPFRESKFAFLYCGSGDIKYQRNLASVYEMLTVFCNYPEENIFLYMGGTYDPAILPQADGVVMDTSEFRQRFYEFAIMCADSNPGTTRVNTVMLYFTGVADDPIDINGSFNQKHPTYYVTPTEKILPNIFQASLRGFDPGMTSRKHYYGNSSVHICFDIDKAGQMDEFLNSLGILEGSLTLSCASGETSLEDTLSGESTFTHFWTRAFRMVGSVVGTTTIYPDTMTSGTEPVGNEMVSLGKACAYAGAIINDPGQNPTCVYLSTETDTTQYLGAPWPEIRDGNPVWQSPDIKLKHPVPGGDPLEYVDDPGEDYIDDYELDTADCGTAGYQYRNHIQVNVWNTGTHPMFHLKLGVVLYETGCGGTSTSRNLEVNLRSATGSEIIIPVPETDGIIGYLTDEEDPSTIYSDGLSVIVDDVCFITDQHRCIRAKAVIGTDPDPDMNVWDIVNMDNEAQRNINNTFVSSEPWDQGDTGGEGDDIDPEGSGGTGSSGGLGVTGISKFPFTVRNPFSQRKKFRIVISGELTLLTHLLKYRIYRTDRVGLPGLDPVKLLQLPGGGYYFDVTLKANETARYLAVVVNVADMGMYDSVTADVSIFVETAQVIWGDFYPHRRWPFMPRFVLLAGFTLIIRFEEAGIRIEIKDAKGKPFADQWVILKSKSGLLKARYKTDKCGILKLDGINPGRYTIEFPGNARLKKLKQEINLLDNPYRVMRLKVKG